MRKRRAFVNKAEAKTRMINKIFFLAWNFSISQMTKVNKNIIAGSFMAVTENSRLEGKNINIAKEILPTRALNISRAMKYTMIAVKILKDELMILIINGL